MPDRNASENTAAESLTFGTKHFAALVNKSESTVRELAARGILNPARTSTGRCLWTPTQLHEHAAYEASKNQKGE